jgi:signal transduction histidine kinase
VLDTAPEAAFDDITRLAAYVCRTPTALISLVDEHRQWFKAAVGLDAKETGRDESFCGHAIHEPDLLVVNDALLDPRFAGNPLVTGGPKVRFYAGAQLRSSEGFALGTICVIDTEPHVLSAEQKGLLQALARQAMAQLELRRTLALAEQANSYRARLMAVAGHDLKQPLQVVTAVLDRFHTRTTDEKERDRASIGLESAREIGRQLDSLARASRLDDETPAAQVEPFCAARVLRPLAGNWSFMAEKRGLSLSVVASQVQVLSDPALLSTILNNLIGNALKYTDRGGVVVGVRRRGEVLRFEVHDTGRGISPEQQATIFHAFTQADPTVDGLGLGLAIVRRTAEVLHHRVSVVSEPGKGSCFAVEVPRL